VFFLAIHVVKPGESIYSIAKIYGVSPTRIISENELTTPNALVVGQTIVISGGRKIGTIEVNGYALPTTSTEVIRKTAPYLTYLCIFSYEAQADGSLVNVNDTPLIEAAKKGKAAPIMVVNNIKEGGGFNSDIASSILNNAQVQTTLINNILSTIKAKGYHGLNIDFEYLYPKDRESYNSFLSKISGELKAGGYILLTSLAPKTSAAQKGLLYEAHDYPFHGKTVDRVVLMTYEWGFTYSPPMAVAPLNEVKKVLNYAVTAIPPSKILMGIPNYGYDWTLPYVKGSAADAIPNKDAIELAAKTKTTIQYDPVSQAPFFRYYDSRGLLHVVWFEDARSINAKLRLAKQYGLAGVSYWTIGSYFPQNWLVVESLYNIKKVI
jgi:spore germination protein